MKPAEGKDKDVDKPAKIFARHELQVRRFLLSRLGSVEDAEDLAHETYLRLTRVKHLNLIRNPEAYLIRIASNLFNELKLDRNKELSNIPYEDVENTKHEGDKSAFEDTLENRAEITRLENLLKDLPPHYAAVLLMRKRDGYSPAEIAEKLGITHSTVTTYLKRALAQVRAEWAEQ